MKRRAAILMGSVALLVLVVAVIKVAYPCPRSEDVVVVVSDPSRPPPRDRPRRALGPPSMKEPGRASWILGLWRAEFFDGGSSLYVYFPLADSHLLRCAAGDASTRSRFRLLLDAPPPTRAAWIQSDVAMPELCVVREAGDLGSLLRFYHRQSARSRRPTFWHPTGLWSSWAGLLYAS